MLPDPSSFIGPALADLLGGTERSRQRPDFRHKFYVALAKVLGAAAWADGAINQVEVNVIKRLLHDLDPRLTSRELKRVERYLTDPVDTEHWMQLLAELLPHVRRRGRLAFAFDRIEALLGADGTPVASELLALAQARSVLDGEGRLQDLPVSAGYALPSSGARPGAAGLQLGSLPLIPGGRGAAGGGRSPTSGPPTAGPAGQVEQPTLVDRVYDTAAAALRGRRELPSRKLCVLAVTIADVLQPTAVTASPLPPSAAHRAVLDWVADVTGTSAATAALALDAASEHAVTDADRVELAVELLDWTSAGERTVLSGLLDAASPAGAATMRLQALVRRRPAS